MIFSKNEVFIQCALIAPKYGFDVKLIQALCMQECEHRVMGNNGKLFYDANAFRADKARLEQGYYDRYVERQNVLSTVNEILLACSFGVTQMMGLSLKEAGFFSDWFNSHTADMQKYLGNPLSEISIPKALNSYCDNLSQQIEYGCKWLTKKQSLAKGDLILTLSYWNGDRTPEHKYANEVLTKMRGLQ
jgi:hypothetical protein